MSTILYRNAKAFIDDSELEASLTDLSIDYSAETLDATTFGNDTRVKVGGLLMAKISGKGYMDALGVVGLEGVVFRETGVDDVVFSLFPDGITEGSLAGGGYAMKGVISDFKLGGAVGTLLPVEFTVEARGIQ